MTRITIDLEEKAACRLAAIAAQRDLTAEELVRSSILVMLDTHQHQFEAALEQVVTKNRELYRRLA